MLCSQGDPGTSYFPLFSPLHWNLCRQVSDNGGSRISQTGGHQPQKRERQPIILGIAGPWGPWIRCIRPYVSLLSGTSSVGIIYLLPEKAKLESDKSTTQHVIKTLLNWEVQL